MAENLNKTKYFLGIDYGEAKIGLAIADSEMRIAFAYGTLKNDKKMLQNILNIIDKEKIETVVIGVPKRSGDKNTTYAGEKLGEILRKGKTDVYYQDEIYSTKMARENLKEKGMKKISRMDHQEAAKIILENFLV